MIRESVKQAMRDFKSEGHTRQEVADAFGVAISTVTNVCRGIAPQKMASEDRRSLTQAQHEKTRADRENKAKELIASLGFEYVGGYTMTDSFVKIRCPKCGCEFERSMSSLRHSRLPRCPRCVQIAKVEALMIRADKRGQAEKLRNSVRAKNEMHRQEVEAEKAHPCPVCGELTTRKVYCSKECARKAGNAQQEARRRAKVKDALIDKDITLKRLYERDHGTCYLCGEKCDWEDKEERDGTIICGDRYPSVEHVIPLSKGGEHSWENVRLAHRICNTRKRDRIPSTTSSLTTSKSRTAVSVSVNG